MTVHFSCCSCVGSSQGCCCVMPPRRREVALDGLRSGVPAAHSVLLCFFFGPTGLLSHALTRLLLGGGRRRTVTA
jgi:hypothetical protein